MILDDYNSNLYLDNKVIHLTKSENNLMNLFIKNKNGILTIKNISKEMCCAISTIYPIIKKLNKKMNPYAQINIRYKRGHSLIINPSEKFTSWKIQFLEEHKKTYLLLKLYAEKEKIEKNIKILEKEIF